MSALSMDLLLIVLIIIAFFNVLILQSYIIAFNLTALSYRATISRNGRGAVAWRFRRAGGELREHDHDL